MKKQVLVAGLLAATLCMPLAACGGSSTSSASSSSSTTTSSTSTTSSSSSNSSSSEFDANKAHADLLTDTGTWEGTEDQITLHLSSKDITLKVVDKNTLEGNAADFGIADFDTINFDFYG